MRRGTLSDLTFRLAATVGLCAALLWMASCNANGSPESDRQIQQQAQQATENAKKAADKAAAEARVAAANAEREANDVARGVKAGLHNGKGGGVDLNSASRADLEALPGVTVATARRIENNRPYATPHDLVRKGVVSEAEYERMAGNVVTR
jgi:DNA uptake protein ComE-like DNA-binding protein